MKLVGSNILSLKYLSCTTTGCRDIEIKKSEFVGETQFLCVNLQVFRTNFNNLFPMI